MTSAWTYLNLYNSFTIFRHIFPNGNSNFIIHYKRKPKAFVANTGKSSLFKSIAIDYNQHVDTRCKHLCRAWGLPPDMHCALLPRLSNSLPVCDKLAKCCVQFIQRCRIIDSRLVKFIG